MQGKVRLIVIVVILFLVLAGVAQARPVAPDAAPAYLNAGLPAGATARLECDGWLDVTMQDTSEIEIVCQPWVLAPGD